MDVPSFEMHGHNLRRAQITSKATRDHVQGLWNPWVISKGIYIPILLGFECRHKFSQMCGKQHHLPRLRTISNHSPSQPYMLTDQFSTLIGAELGKPCVPAIGRRRLSLKWCVLAPACAIGFGEIPRRL